MNIKDEPIKADPKKDLLIQMFKAQEEVEKKFGEIEGFPTRLLFGDGKNLHSPEVCKHINNNIFWRMIQEINEAVVALNNAKTWRQTKYFTDINEYYDEVADIMIYFINACFASGIDPELLATLVLKKIKVNEKRIKSKY